MSRFQRTCFEQFLRHLWKMEIAVLNEEISSLLTFLAWPFLPSCQSLCYFQLDLFSLLSCLGFKLFCVTARRGNSEPLLFSDPEPEDYGNVISSLSHHQPFSTLFAKCQPPRSKKSCLYKCQQTNHSEPEDFGNVNSVGLLLLLVSSSTYFDSFPLEKHQSTTVKRYNVGLQTNKPSGAGGLWKCDLDRGLCDSSLCVLCLTHHQYCDFHDHFCKLGPSFTMSYSILIKKTWIKKKFSDWE